MKEQIQKYARKHIKGGCYPKVTLGHRGLTIVSQMVSVSIIRALIGARMTGGAAEHLPRVPTEKEREDVTGTIGNKCVAMT
jgi:hypothetical protein